MTSLAENPAALDPARVLTKQQKNALIAVSFYRNQVERAASFMVGKTCVAKATMTALEKLELLRRSGRGFAPTLAGKMAVERLKGDAR